MFRENEQHLQASLMSDLDLLTPKQRKRLDRSWAGVFRREVFARIDESPFAKLYASEPSRPNTPVNVLFGLEVLKAAHNWSDEEMHDAFSFDVQVRYALGYDNLGQGEFDLRTVYNFRHRLSEHMARAGENLIEQAFQQVTQDQLGAFQLHTERLRMDSTQIASNIRHLSRLQLLVEMLLRTHRMLAPADRTHYAAEFAPYLQGTSGQYVYHLRREDTAPHLQRIGELVQRLLVELAPTYATHATYQLLQRVFTEHFTLSEVLASTPSDEEATGAPSEGRGCADNAPVDSVSPAAPARSASPTGAPAPTIPPEAPGTSAANSPQAAVPPSSRNIAMAGVVQTRPGTTLRANSLASPDDPEVTYRKKGNQRFLGYVTNVTETCDPVNPFQLIVHVQSAPNATADVTFLQEAVPDLKNRTGVQFLYTDGAYCSPAADLLLREYHVTQIPTALTGYAPHPDHLSLVDFQASTSADGFPVQLTCPQGQSVAVLAGHQAHHWLASFDSEQCAACPLTTRCPTQALASGVRRPVRFTQAELDLAQRRQRCRAYHVSQQFLRVAVEATVGALKRPFSDDQLPVRGLVRVGQMMIESAMMVNVRRIQRHLAAKEKRAQQASKTPNQGQTLTASADTFLSSLWRYIKRQWPVPNMSPAPFKLPC